MSTKSAQSETFPARREEIAVFFPGALGDFICFMPALQIIARQSNIHLFARSEFADLAPSNVWVRSHERYEIRRLFAPGAAADDRVLRFFDAYARVYSWTGSRQEEFVRQFSRLSAGRGRIFPFRANAAHGHQAEYYVSCIAQNGGEVPLPDIPEKPEAGAWSADFWARHGLENRSLLMLAPGSGGREKIWPVEHFRAVADWWRRTRNGAVGVIVGPVEEERGGFEALASGGMLLRNLTLAELAALLRRTALYVGNDSGITHLAAAVGVQTVALFGPSNPQTWRPRGKRVLVLQATPSPVTTNGPAEPHLYRKSLPELTPGEVIAEVEKLREVASLTRMGPGIKVLR
jgi:ADP-heptose:LPS heptosyltransferase